MEHLDCAAAAARVGDAKESARQLESAYRLEREAALRSVSLDVAEPTRSVLLRSAATLAHRSGDLREAERLVGIGLSGNPPDDIAVELRHLYENINLSRHFQVEGTPLRDGELQLSMAGEWVGAGFALSEDITKRLGAMQKLIYRTAEFEQGLPYRRRAAPPNEIRDSYKLFVSKPRAASFAVTVLVGRSAEQMEMSDRPAIDVIDAMLDRLKRYADGGPPAVKEVIRDDIYAANFIGIVDQIAPTGGLRAVGLTVFRNGEESAVVLDRDSLAAMRVANESHSSGEEYVTVVGELLLADKIKPGKEKIQVLDEDKRKHEIRVPEGLMDDIVRPYWGQMVVVEGYRRKSKRGRGPITMRSILPHDS